MRLIVATALAASLYHCGQGTQGTGQDSAIVQDAIGSSGDPCTGPMSLQIPFGTRPSVDRCGANCLCRANRILECTPGICATPPPNLGCNTLPMSVNAAFVLYTTEAQMPPAGGSIVPGLYQLERVVVYGSASAVTLIPTLRMSLRTSASTWEFASQEESVFTRATFAINTSGSMITLTPTCGAPRNPVTYSVVGAELYLQWTDRSLQRVYQYRKVE